MICPPFIAEVYRRAEWTIDSVEPAPLQNRVVVQVSQRPPLTTGHRIRRDCWSYLGEWVLLGKETPAWP